MIADATEMVQRIPTVTWVTGGAAAFVAFLAGLAFSQGVVKQLVRMVCLAAGLSAAWFCFRHRVEVFGPSGATMSSDRLMLFSAGIGLMAYGASQVVLNMLSAIGLISLAAKVAGWRGMALSLLPSGFLLWAGTVALRLIGNFYGMEAASAVAREGTRIQSSFGDVVNSVRRAMDHSVIGSFIAGIDPFSMRPTANLARLLIVWPDQRIFWQMTQDPKIKRIYSDVRMLKLGQDAEVRKCIERKDFPGLIQLPQVEKTASQSDLRELLDDVEMEDAMDTVLYGRAPKKKKTS